MTAGPHCLGRLSSQRCLRTSDLLLSPQQGPPQRSWLPLPHPACTSPTPLPLPPQSHAPLLTTGPSTHTMGAGTLSTNSVPRGHTCSAQTTPCSPPKPPSPKHLLLWSGELSPVLYSGTLRGCLQRQSLPLADTLHPHSGEIHPPTEVAGGAQPAREPGTACPSHPWSGCLAPSWKSKATFPPSPLHCPLTRTPVADLLGSGLH